MTLEIFVQILWTVFKETKNVQQQQLFFGHFWANFGFVSHSPVIQFY